MKIKIHMKKCANERKWLVEESILQKLSPIKKLIGLFFLAIDEID